MSGCVVSRADLLGGYLGAVPALIRAVGSEMVTVAGATIRIPGSVHVRGSVVAGNVRMRAIVDALVQPGDTVVDVGANIGAFAVHAAHRVGPHGRVVAIEPAPDNLVVLAENVRRNAPGRIAVVPAAAGRRSETRTLYLRGEMSAVSSLYADSCYGGVSGHAAVDVQRLDDIVAGTASVVKLDVEGAELDVLDGMSRLLQAPNLIVITEWHPALQRAAGFEADQLPHWLLERGFALQAVGHTSCTPFERHDIEPMMRRLLRRQRPVELVARRGAENARRPAPAVGT